MFFIRTLATFFARTFPASSMANPACMKKMRKETVRTHPVLTELAIAAASTMGTVSSIGTGTWFPCIMRGFWVSTGFVCLLVWGQTHHLTGNRLPASVSMKDVAHHKTFPTNTYHQKIMINTYEPHQNTPPTPPLTPPHRRMHPRRRHSHAEKHG